VFARSKFNALGVHVVQSLLATAPRAAVKTAASVPVTTLRRFDQRLPASSESIAAAMMANKQIATMMAVTPRCSS
jgi:hypothetical protein